MNATVQPVRHMKVTEEFEYYLRITNEKGKSVLITVGKKALENVEKLLESAKPAENAVAKQK